MPRLIDLVTPAELNLLALVPVLPVPLDEFVGQAVANRGVASQLLYALFSTIPGAELGPVAGDYSWVSPYTDYAGWLQWFLARRRSTAPAELTTRPAEVTFRPNVDDQAVRRDVVNQWRRRHGLPPLRPDEPIPRVVSNDNPLGPHVWAPWQTAGGWSQRRTSRRRRPQNPLAAVSPELGDVGRKGVITDFEPRR